MKIFSSRKAGIWMASVVGILLLFLLLGCQKTIQPAKTSMEMASEPPPKLTLGPGDVLDVKFFYAPELNESQTVRPDGKITLQLVGDVDVTGKTPLEVKEVLVKAYAEQLKKPEVAVIVRSLTTRRVYVGGEIRTPGLIALPGNLTVLEAIMQAGGFNLAAADIKNVVVIRQREGRHYGTVLDFNETLQGKENQAFYLQPQDIIYVSRTAIVNINQWIDQYINRIVPQVGLSYQKYLGDGQTMGIGPR